MSLRTRLFSIHRRNLHVQSWNLPASPGGTLKIRLPTTCTLNISSLDPHKTDWTTANIHLEILPETDGGFISEETARQVADHIGISALADREPGRNYLQIEAPPESTPTAFARTLHAIRAWIGGPFRSHRPRFASHVVLHAFVPARFDLDVELRDGGVTVNDTFEGDVKIHTTSADVKVEKLKSMYVDIEADDGDVEGGVLQGNVSIRTAAGNVEIGRVQGPSVRVVTATGDVKTSAMYADYASIRTNEGTVKLGGAQGYVKVRTVEGDVEVSGVEGRLDVETDVGDVEANLSVPRIVSIKSRCGDIQMGVENGLAAAFLLEGGESVHIGEGVVFRRDVEEGAVVRGTIEGETEDKASVHARAPNGDVLVRRRVWGDWQQTTVTKQSPRQFANSS